MPVERLKDIIVEEAYRNISLREGERNVTVPMAQAVIRAMAVKAAKGDHRSQRLFSELLTSTETANRIEHEKLLDVAMTYKIDWERELARRKRLGIIDAPDPLPHPDQVRIDLRNGSVQLAGPLTKEEREQNDFLLGLRKETNDNIRKLRQSLESETDEVEREDLQLHIDMAESVLDKIKNHLFEKAWSALFCLVVNSVGDLFSHRSPRTHTHWGRHIYLFARLL